MNGMEDERQAQNTDDRAGSQAYAYPYGAPPYGQGAPPPGGYPPQGYYPPGYGMPPPYWGPMTPPIPNHPKANPGLVMGIISLSLNFVTLVLAGMCGPGAFVTVIASIVLGIIAVVFGRKAKREIHENPDKYKGEGQASAAIVCGAISLVIAGILFVLGTLLTVFFILVLFFPGVLPF